MAAVHACDLSRAVCTCANKLCIMSAMRGSESFFTGCGRAFLNLFSGCASVLWRMKWWIIILLQTTYYSGCELKWCISEMCKVAVVRMGYFLHFLLRREGNFWSARSRMFCTLWLE